MRYQKTIILIACVLVSAPFWSPWAQHIGHHNTFLRPDALVLMSLMLFTGVACAHVLPSQVVHAGARLIPWGHKFRWWLIGLFLLILFVTLVLVNKQILHSFMNSGDEHSCYFLAECFRNGAFWAKPHPLSEFFQVAHVGNKDGKWFSVYPPGWPFLFALGLELNMGDVMNPIMAVVATAIFFLIGRRLYGFWSAAIGTLLMSSTPFFLFNNASYYSHTTCLLMIAIFIYAYLRWKDRSNHGWAVLAALAIGYGLSARYLTIAAIGGLYLLYEFIDSLKRRSWSSGHVWFTCVFVVMLVLNLWYNHVITGNWLDPPNHYYHRWERLGFHSDYTPLDSVIFVVARFFYLIDWVAGGLVVAYFVYLVKRFTKGDQPTLFPLSFLFLVAGYLFYYSWGGNQYGPRYYFEGIPFIAMPAGSVLVHWWSQDNVPLKKFIIGAILATLLANVYLFSKHAFFFERVSRERKALYELAEKTVSQPAIVFIRGLLGDALIMTEKDSARNEPSLDGKILYARDLGPKNKQLKEFYPERDYFLGSFDRKQKVAKLEPL